MRRDPAASAELARFLAGGMGAEEEAAYAASAQGDAAKLVRAVRVSQGHCTIREAREAAGLSVGQAARVLSWPRQRVIDVEGGDAATAGELSALAEAYGVDGFAGAGPPA